MEIQWTYQGLTPISVKEFVKIQGLPRKFMAAVKHQGGRILVNSQDVTVRAILRPGDQLVIVPPIEAGYDSVPPSDIPIDIVFEDRDLLVVNKPIQTVSIPSLKNPDSSMANRIKGYYVNQAYYDQVIHIVTRLDRDTTGLMLVAKHRLAHAFLDKQLQAGALKKYYMAISQGTQWETHGQIQAPIARNPESIISRRVHSSGQAAVTLYERLETYPDGCLLRLHLLTGRTHQIRVHLAHLGGPLVGDTLYQGRVSSPIYRQALHCSELNFVHPFSHQRIHLKTDLPPDMATWLDQRRSV